MLTVRTTLFEWRQLFEESMSWPDNSSAKAVRQLDRLLLAATNRKLQESSCI